MQRPKEEFWYSTFAQIVKMIDMYLDEMQMKAAAVSNEQYNSKYFRSSNNREIRDIKSMHEIEGW
jgi:hypothetical protein